MNRDPRTTNSAEFTVVPYHRSCLDGIRALWREHLGEQALATREAQFLWFNDRHPLGPEGSGYYLLLHRDRVIGMHGHMPVEYQVGHERFVGHMAHDDLLARDYRGRGLGRVLLQSVARLAPLFSGALWHNAANLKLYEKSGWTNVPGFHGYVKVIDPAPFFRRHLNTTASGLLAPPARALLRAVDRVQRVRRSERLHVTELLHFGPEVDALFERVSCRLGIVVCRTAASLTWRFLRKPWGAYRVRAVYDSEGELCGYAVLKVGRLETGRWGRIVDLLVDGDTPGAFDELLSDACAQFSAENVTHIELACTHRPFVARLARHGFMRARKPYGFMVTGWQERFRASQVRDIHNWYLTLGDADGDAWIPDEAWAQGPQRQANVLQPYSTSEVLFERPPSSMDSGVAARSEPGLETVRSSTCPERPTP
jgi:GNAT superfamily N-acetyltransferase